MTTNYRDLVYPKLADDTHLSCPDVNDPDAFAARVYGDSMAPEYADGDIVIVSPRAEANDGDDAFVKLASGGTTFKRVFFEESEAGESVVRLQPRNVRHPPRVVGRDEVVGIFPAVYRYSRVNVR